MVPAKGKKFGLWVGWVGESWDAGTKFEEGRRHLVEGKGIVKRCNGDITTIKNSIW